MKIHSGVASLTSLLLLVPVPGYATPPVKAPPFAAYVSSCLRLELREISIQL